MELDSYPNVFPSQKKKRKAIPPELRRQVWQTYMPSGAKEALCPLCNERPIQSSKTKAGFECAHIVCHSFMDQELSVLFLFPSCPSCNNECEEVCLLDYLWQRSMHTQLRRMIRSIYDAYISLNPELSTKDLLMWNVLARLYGYERFKLGGGIVNEIAIYTLARSEHMLMLNERIQRLQREFQAAADEMREVAEAKITSSRPRFV